VNRIMCVAIGAAGLYAVQYFTGALVPHKKAKRG
jgi:hypothetical protein